MFSGIFHSKWIILHFKMHNLGNVKLNHQRYSSYIKYSDFVLFCSDFTLIMKLLLALFHTWGSSNCLKCHKNIFRTYFIALGFIFHTLMFFFTSFNKVCFISSTHFWISFRIHNKKKMAECEHSPYCKL